MPRKSSYTTGNLLLYWYHQSCYKLFHLDLSRQTNTSISQQISLIGKLEVEDGTTIFSIAEKQDETILKFF